jgi:hypothetical protein
MKALSTIALLVCLGLPAFAQTAATTEDLVKLYRLSSTPLVTVRTPDGTEKTIKLIGAVLESNGVCKVSTYFVPAGSQ